jgi:hypothetical protein
MMTFPIYGKIKHVPNHQPDIHGPHTLCVWKIIYGKHIDVKGPGSNKDVF